MPMSTTYRAYASSFLCLKLVGHRGRPNWALMWLSFLFSTSLYESSESHMVCDLETVVWQLKNLIRSRWAIPRFILEYGALGISSSSITRTGLRRSEPGAVERDLPAGLLKATPLDESCTFRTSLRLSSHPQLLV